MESLFVKVYYKGRPEGVCHNEVVFKAFTKYRGDTRKKVLIRGFYSVQQRIDKKQWWKVSQFVLPPYLDINPAIIILGIFHKNILKFQVPVHYV